MSRGLLALHGHFYQPPRDDPRTGTIPREPSAEPFANWNERINAECYRPNADLGNFEVLSFDLGPTLMRWLGGADPETHDRITAAARRDSAWAQPYHHTILPLAPRRDKKLQVAWGLADFEHRFGFRPRALWLPETAADRETLEVVAEAGIELVLLAPWQAAEDEVDVSRPHWVELGADRRLGVFFFHRELSARLSFDPEATADADRFMNDLVLPVVDDLSGDGSPRAADADRLLLLASDGELYGHHQKFRDLFLRRLAEGAADAAGVPLTTPLRVFDRSPPTDAVELRREGSWSCHHGIERWRGACPCTPKAEWKAPFRRAMDRLGAELDRIFRRTAAAWVEDPEHLLRRWIEVELGRTPAEELIRQEARPEVSDEAVGNLRSLLEAQWNRQRMMVSCAWFHDDLDRLEPRYALAAAARAIELTRRVSGEDPAPRFRAYLRGAVSPRTGRSAVSLFDAVHRPRRAPA